MRPLKGLTTNLYLSCWSHQLALPLDQEEVLSGTDSRLLHSVHVPWSSARPDGCSAEHRAKRQMLFFCHHRGSTQAELIINVCLGHCRCLCGRSDRAAVCIYLLPPTLPALSAHGLPPALCQPGCCRPPAPASARRPAAHQQRHHPSPGELD